MDTLSLSDLIQRHEGLRLKPYTDTVGKLTIGVGHNLTDKGITEGQARIILTDDISDTTNFLNMKLPWWVFLDSVRQMALADMTFDLMGKVLDFHAMLNALQMHQWDAAADALLASLFAKQVGKRAQDLAQMIRTGKM